MVNNPAVYKKNIGNKINATNIISTTKYIGNRPKTIQNE